MTVIVELPTCKTMVPVPVVELVVAAVLGVADASLDAAPCEESLNTGLRK